MGNFSNDSIDTIFEKDDSPRGAVVSSLPVCKEVADFLEDVTSDMTKRHVQEMRFLQSIKSMIDEEDDDLGDLTF